MRRGGSKAITSKTQLPKQAVSTVSFTTGKELVLRSSPRKIDTYDEVASEMTDGAVFGNILSKYLPGCTGHLLGRQPVHGKESWCFVVLSRECNPLRTHAAYSVNSGWTNCGTLNLKGCSSFRAT
jgi:hypothetical protein